MLLDTNEKLFSHIEEEAFINMMKIGDPEWTYIACHDPKGTGYSFIEIYDENGDFVSKV